MLQQVAGVGIHITHQHLMPIVADQFADIGQLTGTGARPQGQVHHHHHNGLGPFAETHQNRAPAGRPRQWVIFQQGRAQTTEDAIAVLGKTPEIAVELLVPVGEGPQMGQVFDLIDVARAQAAAIDLLQGHQVEIAEHVANPLQVAGAPRMGQQVLPAAGQVVVIALGADADLDIEAEQAQATVTGPVAGWRTSRVDLWVAQTNGAAGGAAAQHRRGRRLLGRSLFADQVVGHLQYLLWATGAADVEAVFAVDHHHRYAADLVGHGQFLGLFQLAFHPEGIVGLEEGVLIDAFAREEVSHLFRGCQLLALFVDAIEYGGVHLRPGLHRFEGDKQLAVYVPHAAEHGRDAHEIDVIRQLLDPGVEGRLELVAMATAIPEQLDHFDLARLGNLYRIIQLDILLAGFEFGMSRRAKQAGHHQGDTENQVTHALLLGYKRCAVTNHGSTSGVQAGSIYCSDACNENGWPKPPIFYYRILPAGAISADLARSWKPPRYPCCSAWPRWRA